MFADAFRLRFRLFCHFHVSSLKWLVWSGEKKFEVWDHKHFACPSFLHDFVERNCDHSSTHSTSKTFCFSLPRDLECFANVSILFVLSDWSPSLVKSSHHCFALLDCFHTLVVDLSSHQRSPLLDSSLRLRQTFPFCYFSLFFSLSPRNRSGSPSLSRNDNNKRKKIESRSPISIDQFSDFPSHITNCGAHIPW